MLILIGLLKTLKLINLLFVISNEERDLNNISA